MVKIFKNILVFGIGSILGATSLYFYIANSNKVITNDNDNQPLYWVGPMTPDYKSDKPGKSPMGMDLVPVYADGIDNSGVTISSTVINNIGIKTKKVEYKQLQKNITALGVVKEDKNNIAHIHLYRKAWVKELYVSELGDRVEKDQVIARVYSPELFVDERDYLSGYLNKNARLAVGSKERMLSLGVSQQQIDRISRNKKPDKYIDILSPIGGIVSKIDTREGMYVEPGKNIVTIVDLDVVWVSAEVFPSQVKGISLGDEIIATINQTNDVFRGKVDFISPEIDPITRTVSIRTTLFNKDGILRPNLYMDISIIHELPNELVIPSQAIIKTKDIDYVIINDKKNHFIAQEIKIGAIANGYTQVLKGLKLGDEVVTSSQFLIDSESNVREGIRRITNMVKTVNNDSMYNATGVVKSIDVENRIVTIAHNPIEEFSLPAMEMEFGVGKNVNIKSMNLNEKINFRVMKMNNKYIITSIMMDPN